MHLKIYSHINEEGISPMVDVANLLGRLAGDLDLGRGVALVKHEGDGFHRVGQQQIQIDVVFSPYFRCQLGIDQLPYCYDSLLR